MPRAFLRLGPGSLAHHQLALALALECQKIICIARGAHSEIHELQISAERAGARFHLITGTAMLPALVTADDDVLVISDGLLAMPQAALQLLQARDRVLVQPVDPGIAAGFERIDINSAAAGLMRVPGHLLERLNDLPPDCDVVSTLTRIALQAGIAQQTLPAELADGLRWRLVRSDAEADEIEARWIAHHLGQDDTPRSLGNLLGRLVMRLVAPALLHSGSGGTMLTIAIAFCLLLALGAAWWGHGAAALILCALAQLSASAAAVLRRVENQLLPYHQTSFLA